MSENETPVEGSEEKSKSQWLPAVLLLLMGAGLIAPRFYEDWKFANEPMTGIGISYQEVVLKSKPMVVKVRENTPASEAGLMDGDVILEVNGQEIKRASDLRNLLGGLPSGSTVNLTVSRAGKKLTLTSRVETRKRKDF